MNRAARNDTGFTIVELLLAMTFVTVLMLAIAVTVIQIGNIYNKGLTMKGVNESGRSISSDLQQTIGQAIPFDESSFQPQRHQGTGMNDSDGGRLCTGIYSYVWNYGKALSDPVNRYSSGDEMIRFVRVRDVGGQYCADMTKLIDATNATEMLSVDDGNLAVHSFTIKRVAYNAALNQAIYRIVMEIGTSDQGALERNIGLDTIDTSCRPPADSESQQDFCAVNKFEFTALAGNKGGL